MKIFFISIFILFLSSNLQAMPSFVESAKSMFANMYNNQIDTNSLFDLWDDNDDKNISTKIVDKKFTLIKDSSNNKLNDEGGKIHISINSNSNIFVSPQDYEDAENFDFNVTVATQDSRVKFKMCADYSGSAFDNLGSIIRLMRSRRMSMEEIINELIASTKINIYPLSDCSSNATDECSFSEDKKIVECFSTDDFAIRPDRFTIEEKKYVKSALKTLYDVTTSDSYNIANSDYDLNISITKYMPNNDVNNSLNGTSTIEYSNFTNGISDKLKIEFSDTAKVELLILDTHWADIDEDDTDGDCSETGRFICGETNTTFIPSHFYITDTTLYNEENSTFTYISNSADMFAHIGLTITAQNDKNETLQNFDKNSWENSLSVDFNTSNKTDINKSKILDKNLSFENGVKNILWNETDSTLNLMFNYERNVNNALNPFKINGSDINISISSLYDNDDINITDNNGKEIADGNATFIYGRTNAPRTRVKGDSGDIPIYYETYCYDNLNNCSKILLPDGVGSRSNDDPRWFINTKHDSSNFGTYGDVSQKNGSKIDTINSQNSVNLKYKGSTYPYKTTMKNRASSWLIYNKYNPNATTNEFEVEFEKGDSKWAGKSATDTVSKNSASQTTNRRTMW